MSGLAWLICGMDDGVLRAEATRTDALDWAKSDACAGRVRERHDYGDHTYGYVLADADHDSRGTYFIGRIDCVARHGYDPQQPPLYPIGQEPHTRIEPALDVTAIVADVSDDQAVLDAWVAAAVAAGLAVTDRHVRNDVEYVPTEAKVAGRWYGLAWHPRILDDDFVVSAERGNS